MTPASGWTRVQYPMPDQATVVAEAGSAVAGRAHMTRQLMSPPHAGIGMGFDEPPPWAAAMSIIMAHGWAAAAR